MSGESVSFLIIRIPLSMIVMKMSIVNSNENRTLSELLINIICFHQAHRRKSEIFMSQTDGSVDFLKFSGIFATAPYQYLFSPYPNECSYLLRSYVIWSLSFVQSYKDVELSSFASGMLIATCIISVAFTVEVGRACTVIVHFSNCVLLITRVLLQIL